jgi:hypothetical protein
MTDTNTKRGRPRVNPAGQPRDYAVEYARRKAGAQKRGEVTTVTNPVNANDRMQAESWHYIFAYARWLAWCANRPQAITAYCHMGFVRYEVVTAQPALSLSKGDIGPHLLWVPVPRRMPRIPTDV